MRRLARDELPQRAFELRRRWPTLGVARAIARIECSQNQSPRTIGEYLMEGPHQSIAHGTRSGFTRPVGDEPSKFAALEMPRGRALIQEFEQVSLPTREKHRAVVELDRQHLRGSGGIDHTAQIVADLLRPCSQIIGNPRSRMRPAHDALGITVQDPRIRGPDNSLGRVAEPRLGGNLSPG